MGEWNTWWKPAVVGVDDRGADGPPVAAAPATAVPDRVVCARCEEHMATMAPDSVDAVVTDPPYGLAFMGKDWDRMGHGNAQQAWHYRWAVEAFRVLKPGGHLVAFGGTRTYHRLVCAVEDAGFEIRDSLHWLYGQGFPKSLDVSKAVTKRADPDKVRAVKLWLAERFRDCGKTGAQINRECGFTATDYLKTEPGNDAGGRATWHTLLPYGEKWATLKRVVGFGDDFDAEIERYGVVVAQTSHPRENGEIYGQYSGVVTDYDLTDAARQWKGWGTALKPGHEPIVLARKPLIGTVASNVIEHGTGGINIDGCRVGFVSEADLRESTEKNRHADFASGAVDGYHGWESRAAGGNYAPAGRWPPNVLLSHGVECAADRCTPGCPVAEINAQSGPAGASAPVRGDEPSKATEANAIFSERQRVPGSFFADSGGAARFFPILDFDPSVDAPYLYTPKASTQEREQGRPEGHDAKRWNNHPTVKPVSIMRWLVRLVTPPGGVVLDPFTGSGTTLVACALEEVSAVGIEERVEYTEIAKRRVAAVKEEV